MVDLKISTCSFDVNDVANFQRADADTGVPMSSRGCFPPSRVLFDGHRSVMGLGVGAASLDAILDEEEVCPSDGGLSC